MSRQLKESQLTLPASEERDHIRGPASAAVTLVEYGDFECPHCGRAHYILNELLAEFADDVRLVFRHFPLAEVHPHAQRAAEASEAAGTQGQFWEMHDVLFENQDALDDESLGEYAQDLGLDLVTFLRDLNAGVHTDRVREDFMSGVRSGVNGTPTFFINGRRHDGPWDLESLAAAIEAEAEADGGSRAERPRVRRRGHRSE
jgi:protein-disulfide isomerase